MGILKRLWKFFNENLVTGILLLVITGVGVTTFFETLWTGVKTIFNYVYNSILFVLNYEVKIWIFIVFVVVVVGGLILLEIWMDNKKSSTHTETSNIEITELEKQILRLFEQHYGQNMNIGDISSLLRNNDMLRIEEGILNLVHNLNYLQQHNNYVDGSSFTLNGNGRNYILTNLR